ncbi:MAG TPA: hypothetical protein VGM29_05810 [Polyangiaceae bacterium]|jgi:hypothetical protein
MQTLAASAFTVLGNRTAHATVMRALSLQALAQRSDRIVLGRALGARSHFQNFPGSQRIVTDVEFQIEDVLGKAPPAESVLAVRMLGGVVGRSGEYVAGQAEFELGAPCVVFLRQLARGGEPYWLTGMAQGHFPVLTDEAGTPRLTPSPRLPDLLGFEKSAVRALSGLTIASAKDALRRVLEP